MNTDDLRNINTLTDCIDIVVRVIDFVLALLLNFNVHGERGERDQIGVSLILYCIAIKRHTTYTLYININSMLWPLTYS